MILLDIACDILYNKNILNWIFQFNICRQQIPFSLTLSLSLSLTLSLFLSLFMCEFSFFFSVN